MGGGGDRDLLGGQVVARADERQSLERLRGGAEEGDPLGVARLLDDGAVVDGDGVHQVRRLDDLAAPDLTVIGLDIGGQPMPTLTCKGLETP